MGLPGFRLDDARRGTGSSPVSVAESPLIHVGGLRRPVESSRPGFWLTATADTTVYDPARAALEIARADVSR